MPRKRQHRYAFYLDDEENEMLLSQTKEYNVSVSKLIRLLILYQCIKFPPKEIRSVVPELRRIGNNLNQIASKAHTLGFVDEREYKEDSNRLWRVVAEFSSQMSRGGVKFGNYEDMGC